MKLLKLFQNQTLFKTKGHASRIVTVEIAYIFNLPVVLEPIYDFYTVLANILPFETLRKASFNIS